MNLKFTGKKLINPAIIKRGKIEETIHPYIVDEGLVKAVNLAIYLKRPLLLMGEPGCGKTRLAQAVAYELYHKQTGEKILQDYKKFYFEWNITSEAKAKDGLYEFDAIERLSDAQGKDNQLKPKKEYVKMRPLGKAIKQSVDDDNRMVLLIDEIDKADIDFSNNLLNELDKAAFRIPESNEHIKSPSKPIVIITSNREKELPDAFLRRCLYHYIKPMGKDLMVDIVNRRYYKYEGRGLDAFDEKKVKPYNDLVDRAVTKFIEIRTELDKRKILTSKNVSLGELLDWYSALKYFTELKADLGEKDETTQQLIADIDENFGNGFKNIPFHQVLLKNWQSLTAYEKSKEV